MLRDKLKKDSVESLKARDERLVASLRYLISVIDKRALQLPVEKMTEAEELAVLRKELKNKEEARRIFVEAKRIDLADQEDYEIAVLRKYLPAEMGREEVVKVVDQVVLEKGKVFGLVMGEVMKRLAGRAGGELVMEIVKQKISE